MSYTALVLCVLALGVVAQVGPGPQCVCFQEFGNGTLYNPISINHMHDGSRRLLVAEERGYIWIFNSDGSLNPTPYLNFTAEVSQLPNLGLMNFVPHPDYANNGRIYVYYVVLESGDNLIRISELTRSTTNPDVIDLDTLRLLYEVSYPYDELYPDLQTQGGALMFGTDGYLYIGFGHGACCFDPFEQAQNKSTPLGSMIRIDVDSRTGNLEYGIPPDNPFLGDPDAIPELFAYGMRQPYSGDIDFGDSSTGDGRGRIFVGEVGAEDYEEILGVLPGENHGWPYWEGPLCHQPSECQTMGPVAEPLIYYNRTVGICVIMNGIYRGCSSPDLNGWMVCQDFGVSDVFGATENPDGTWSVKVIPTCASCPTGLTNSRMALTIGSGVDQNGEFWFGSSNNGAIDLPGDSVYKIVDPNRPGTCPAI